MKPTREEIDTLWSQCIRRSTDKRRRDAFYDAAYSAGRKAGMEEAAKICERLGDEFREREGLRYAELKTDAETGCNDCEYAIRAAMEADK